MLEHLFGQESNEEMAQSLGASAVRSSWREYVTWAEDHQKVTASEVQRVAQQVFLETHRTVGYLVPDEHAPAPDSFLEER